MARLLATGALAGAHLSKVGKHALLLALLWGGVGCHQASDQGSDQGCDRFAEMETRCELDAEGTDRGKLLSMMVCSDAQDAADDWLSQLQARQVQCARQSPSCALYQDCKIQIVLP